MPELPEVETTKEGIKPALEGQIIREICVRNPQLRIPVNPDIEHLSAGKTILAVTRRAKYILLHLSKGCILVHLGMSGHLRLITTPTPFKKHDHVDLILSNESSLRFYDPRRFGLFYYTDADPYQHPLLAHLGPEPLSEAFSGDYLYQRANKRKQAIKAFIMNNEIVVGVGNIYASESLFLTGIHPQMSAGNLSYDRAQSLAEHIKNTLQKAIAAGGTTLKDFYTSQGNPGYFSIDLKVYGRRKQPCYQCNTVVESVVIAGRHSAFCPKCQESS